MNKKGFTLTEIIGAIIILGILVIIAVITFSGNMKGFREDYYINTIRTLTESGKEFFNDNRKYRPNEVLNAQTVPLSILIAQHYIDDVKDYKGNSCSNSSYIIVIKNGKDDYAYHTCLVCPEDDYSNMNDKYCDSAWTNSTTIEYSIARPPQLYIYKGTPKEELRDKLAIKASYVKKNSKGEVIGVVDGTGFDEAPTIYPDNIDGVDTNTLGKYNLTYTYMEKTVEGFVVVYEYKEPDITIKKENIVASSLTGGITKETGNYTSGEWTQKIFVTLKSGAADAGDVSLSTTTISNVVHKYQWNKDGVWQDFCPGDDCTGIEVTTEMNQNISFRSVDVNGVASEVSTPTTVKLDNTKPTCTLVTDGPHIANEWYTGDVTISFTKNEDLVGLNLESVSGAAVSNITKEGGTLTRVEKLTETHDYDVKLIKYIGFIEDNAKNYYFCDTSFKRDATGPICTITNHATLNCSDPTSGIVKVSYTQTNNYNGADSFSPQETWSDSKTITTKGRWYLRAVDYAGNVSQVSSMYCLITYDKNGGDTEPTKKTEVKRETELADLSQVTRKAQYKMIGWNTDKDATTALSSYTVPEETDKTLYAIYEKCGKGYYTNASGNGCNRCPAGYRDGEPAGDINGCKKDVPCGFYVGTTKGQETQCAAAYYSTAHTISYGETSSCTLADKGYYATAGSCAQSQCPEHYRDGTEIANKTSQSACLNNVACGKHVATANHNEVNCDAGYYSSAHTVTYGNTSNCTVASNGYYATAGSCSQTQCPENYRDGTTVANKTSQSACLNNVACGKHVGSAGAAESNCSAGQYKEAHTVTYGNTSSCSNCPVGAYSANAGSCACTDCGAGTYSDNEGSSSCKQCESGYYKTHSSRQGCVACPEGYWCSPTKKNPCDAGKSSGPYSDSIVDCIHCAKGYANNTEGGLCTACPAGEYAPSAGSLTCSSCPAGTYSTGTANVSCTSCPAGQYSSGTGNTSCSSCPAGQYASGTGNTSCSSCSAGKYASGTGNSSCSNCPAGQYSSGTGNSSCSSCTGNTYTSSAGQSSCSSCPAGQTANSSHTGCESNDDDDDDGGSGSGGGRIGGCFLPGTLVVTKDGNKAIEKIKQGDYVLSYNEETKQNEYKKVNALITHKDLESDLYTLTIDNYELKVTDVHRFYVIRKNIKGLLGIKQYIEVQNLVVGDKVVYSDGSYHEITNISYVTEVDTVYNLEVEDNHNYYVSEKEILVHNAKDQELPF